MNKQTTDFLKELYDEGLNFSQIAIKSGLEYDKVKYYFYSVLNLKSNLKGYTVNEKYFDNIDCEHKAYYLGLLFADGNVISKNGDYVVSLALHSKDHDMIESFKKDIEYTGPILKYDYSTLSILRINKKYLVTSLINLGCVPKKSLILKRPTINENLKRHFVRGYLDGDGHIAKECVYILGTYDMCSYMKETCDNLKINSRITSRSNIFRLEIYGRIQSKVFLDFIYNDSTIYLDRKYNSYMKIVTHQLNKIKKCKIEGCLNKHKGYNYCKKHYYIYITKARRKSNFSVVAI